MITALLRLWCRLTRHPSFVATGRSTLYSMLVTCERCRRHFVYVPLGNYAVAWDEDVRRSFEAGEAHRAAVQAEIKRQLEVLAGLGVREEMVN